MFGSIRLSSGMDIRNCKAHVKCIKVCSNLRDLVNFTTAVTFIYFVYYIVHIFSDVALNLNVKIFI